MGDTHRRGKLSLDDLMRSGTAPLRSDAARKAHLILRGNRQVIARRRESLDEVATSWIIAAELSYAAAKSRSPVKKQNLVIEFLATVPVVGLNLPAAEQFGRHKVALERQGSRVADADLLIAAIALAQNATLITGNTRHCERYLVCHIVV